MKLILLCKNLLILIQSLLKIVFLTQNILFSHSKFKLPKIKSLIVRNLNKKYFKSINKKISIHRLLTKIVKNTVITKIKNIIKIKIKKFVKN